MAKKGVTKTKTVVTLKEIIDATNSEAGCLYCFQDEYETLLTQGLVEINPDMKDEYDAIATRATQAGIDHFNASGDVVEHNKPAAVNPSTFEIESGVPITPISRKHSNMPEKGSKYPFAALEVGQSFFLPDGEKAGSAFSALSAAAQVAIVKYSTVDPTGATTELKRGKYKGRVVPVRIYERHFVVRRDEKNGVKGARVWRDEIPTLEGLLRTKK